MRKQLPQGSVGPPLLEKQTVLVTVRATGSVVAESGAVGGEHERRVVARTQAAGRVGAVLRQWQVHHDHCVSFSVNVVQMSNMRVLYLFSL